MTAYLILVGLCIALCALWCWKGVKIKPRIDEHDNTYGNFP